MNDYSIRDHSKLGDVSGELAALAKRCFAEYDGVLEPTPDFMAWYLRRPGMTPESCFVALHDDKIVSNVFVTILKLRLGGRLLDVGMVDSVMTHPSHRQRGLARRVLESAIGFMSDRRLDASVLYTVPDQPPYHFYEGLGYRDHVRITFLAREVDEMDSACAPDGRGGAFAVRRASPSDRDPIIEALNDRYASYDGYAPLGPASWEWRREARPSPLPAGTLVAEGGGELAGLATFAPMRLVAKGQVESSCLITDVVLPPGQAAGPVLEALLGAAPGNVRRVFLSGACNASDNELWRAAGFSPMLGDAAMVLPLSDAGHAALAEPPANWYVLTESVVGI